MKYKSIIATLFFLLVSAILIVSAIPPVKLIVDDGQIADAGLTTTVNLTLNEVPNGLSGYNITVSLSNTSVADVISASFPAWAVIHSNGTLPGDSVWLKASDVYRLIESGSSNVSLATLTIRGENSGNSNISVAIK